VQSQIMLVYLTSLIFLSFNRGVRKVKFPRLPPLLWVSSRYLLRYHLLWSSETVEEELYQVVKGLQNAKNGVKSMIFTTEEGEYILVLNPGNKKPNCVAFAVV
jgi:hypothetical protein